MYYIIWYYIILHQGIGLKRVTGFRPPIADSPFGALVTDRWPKYLFAVVRDEYSYTTTNKCLVSN